MSETAWIAIVSVAVTLITNLVGQYISARKVKPEIRSIDAKTETEIASAATAIAGGSKTAIENLLRSIEYHKQEIAELRTKNDDLEQRSEKEANELKVYRVDCDREVAELQTHRAERDKEIAELKNRVIEMEERQAKMKRVNEKLVVALIKANVDLPDFNGDLSDSIRGYKWNKDGAAVKFRRRRKND